VAGSMDFSPNLEKVQIACLLRDRSTVLGPWLQAGLHDV